MRNQHNDDDTPRQPARGSNRPRPSRREEEENNVDNAPRKNRSKKTSKKPKAKPLVDVLAIGLPVLALAGILVAIFGFSGQDKNKNFQKPAGQLPMVERKNLGEAKVDTNKIDEDPNKNGKTKELVVP